jgi:Na+/H+-dicarboxylate symporter
MSAKNLSSFLKTEVVNPWGISPENVQVIKEENVILQYNGQEKYNSANILGILAFSVVCGVILHTLGEEGKPLVSWFQCLFDVILKLVDLFMW